MTATTSFETLRSELCGLATPMSWILVRRVDSTNRLAMSIASDLAADNIQLAPSTFMAWEQTEGRGRLGHSWTSHGGLGVYCSLLFMGIDQDSLSQLPLAVPLALATVLDRYLDRECELDWPNDLLLTGKKIAGVLIEARSSGSGHAVVGFGVNFGHSKDELPTTNSTSLRLAASKDRELPRLGFLAGELVEEVFRRVRSPSAPETVAEYASRSIHKIGDPLRCRIGDRTIRGLFGGFDDQGHLRLEVDGVEQTIGSGEIVER